MEMKQNQTFFRGIYSNPTLYLFLPKMLKYFNDFQTLRNIFFCQKILKYFNDF